MRQWFLLGKKKTLVAIGLLLILGAGLFAWYFFTVRQETPSLPGETLSQEQEEERANDEGESNKEETTSGLDENVPVAQPKSFVVDDKICEDECSIYQGNQEALSYCQAVCGLSGTEGVARPAPKDCSTLEAVAKDICLRDKAVAENSGALCEEITDKGLRDSCRNRIAEERFD
jgi:hypothetical protein